MIALVVSCMHVQGVFSMKLVLVKITNQNDFIAEPKNKKKKKCIVVT